MTVQQETNSWSQAPHLLLFLVLMEMGAMPTHFTVFAAYIPVHTLASPFPVLQCAGSKVGHRKWGGCREQVRPQDRGMDNEERAAAPAPHRGPEELAAAPVPAIGHGHTL